MSKYRTFLEADSSELESKLMVTNDETELEHLFPMNREPPSKLVRPKPGFCVKARRSDNEKIFVNVCHTESIPPPEDISEQQLLEILNSDTPYTYRIPMSIGEPRLENTKSGSVATTYDIAINTQFYEKVEKNSVFKRFLLCVICYGLQNKYKIEIDEESTTVLKHRSVMGTLQYHRIRQSEIEEKMDIPQKKLIEEIDVPTTPLPVTSSKEPKKSNLSKGNAMSSTKKPPYKIFKDQINEKEEGLICDLYIPDIICTKDITLDVGEDRLVFESKVRGYFLDIFLPLLIVQNKVKADWAKNTGILTITMPIVRSAGILN